MNILVIDDEKSIRHSLKEIFEYENYKVYQAESGEEGIRILKENKIDIILCDIKMPKMDGIETLEKIMDINPDIPVIMISGHGTIETAVEAIKKGAYDYISKPLDLNRLIVSVRNAIEKKEITLENKKLQKKINKKVTTKIIGESKAIKEVKKLIERVAPTNARILITGESGVGKELVARSIHEYSKRAKGPFIEVNCAAIPSELIESELFGHEKGSFTSALKQRKGKFEIAQGGTLFLDEIGDMSLSAQAKVLRALQENKITRVGGDKDILVDVRIIAATNKNLQEEIKKNNFREDLFHRLNVVPIYVPSLKERKEDIPLLIDYFNKEICNEYGIPPKKIEKEAIKKLQSLDWPGNIRELRNIIERLIILSNNGIKLADIDKFV